MEAKPQSINKLFQSGGDIQYVLPHFQREYAWDKTHWDELYEDVVEVYDTSWEESTPEHFLGALVVIQEGESVGTMSRYTLVDGQQRLTTISLLLCALKEVLDPNSRLRGRIEKLLVNPDEEDNRYFYKIVPTLKRDDRKAYFAIIDGERTVKYKSGIVKAYDHFLQILRKAEKDINTQRLFDSIVNRMQVVFITLKRDEKPYKIFETLNARGKNLSQADLVRNYVAMRLETDKQEEVFNRYWADIDSRLSDQSKKQELSSFLRHYLAMTTYTLPNEKQVYARFRDYMEHRCPDEDSFVSELGTLRKFAIFYEKLLRPALEDNPQIRDGIKRLNVVLESVSYPCLMFLYDAAESSRITDMDFSASLALLENYGVRRLLAGEPTNYYNKMFPTLPRDVDIEDCIPSLTSLLLNKNYPSNNSIRLNLENMHRLGSASRKRFVLVLESIDRHLARGTGGYPILDDDPTIEHIMPQTLGDAWRQHIGEDHHEVHSDLLNNLGNLTLVTQQWNAELSNGKFEDKKRQLANHALRINSGYFCNDIPKWNRSTILDRTDWLTKLALEVWPHRSPYFPPPDVAGSTPSAVIIVDERFPVDTWRNVMVKTVEVLIPQIADFEAVAKRFSNRMGRHSHHFNSHEALSNGWYLNLVGSHNAIYTFCKKFAQAAGLDDTEWHAEYE